MRQTRLTDILIFLLLLLAQIVICNFLHVTPYIMLSILPVMILCLPVRYGPVVSMIIAFASGMAVDLLAEGVPGLNTAALLPVAFARFQIIRLVFGSELFARGEDFTTQKSGMGKVTVAILLAQTLFLVIYIWLDGAGIRPLWFNALRFVCSLAAGVAVSIFVADLMAGNDRKN